MIGEVTTYCSFFMLHNNLQLLQNWKIKSTAVALCRKMIYNGEK